MKSFGSKVLPGSCPKTAIASGWVIPTIFLLTFILHTGFQWGFAGKPKAPDEGEVKKSSNRRVDFAVSDPVNKRAEVVAQESFAMETYIDTGESVDNADLKRVSFDESGQLISNTDLSVEEKEKMEKLKKHAENLAKQGRVASRAGEIKGQVHGAGSATAARSSSRSSSRYTGLPRIPKIPRTSGVSQVMRDVRMASGGAQNQTPKDFKKKVAEMISVQKDANRVTKPLNGEILKLTEQAKAHKKILDGIKRARSQNASGGNIPSTNDIIAQEKLRLLQDEVQRNKDLVETKSDIEAEKEKENQ